MGENEENFIGGYEKNFTHNNININNIDSLFNYIINKKEQIPKEFEKYEKAYKDYLVRKVTEEIGEVFANKMDQSKKELKEMQYEEILNKTEEILKNYKKLSDHIVLT